MAAPPDRHALGRTGEARAAAHLESAGLRLIERNYRCRFGEIDLVAIEHDMEFLFGLADRISVVHWGQVIASGRPEALKQNPWVQASNLGRLQ